jgi:hypothetical protein
MYISNILHFLDEKGNIPKQMPKEARQMASFLGLIVDETTKKLPIKLTPTSIRCFEKGCEGIISSEILFTTGTIHWVCNKCENEGMISEWHNTKWNNNRC